MKKIVTSSLLISSIVLAPALKADGFTEIAPDMEQLDTPEVAENDDSSSEELATEPQNVPEDSEGTPVGQAANEGTNTAKRRQWQNIVIATGAIALAVTALILVASNDGHHHHKGDSK